MFEVIVMNVWVLIIIILFIIGFIAAFPFIGIPAIAILIIVAIIKRKSIKAWYDNLPNNEKQENQKTDSSDSQKTTEIVSNVKTSTKKHSEYDPNALDFEDEHEKDIERWRNKIEKMEDSAEDKENPDDVVSTLRKAVSLCDDFREFCSLYVGGTSYYDDNEANVKERIERDIEYYLENEYEDAKIEYEELQQEKRIYSALKKEILNTIISSDNGLLHKDIFVSIPPENKNLAERALKELVNTKKISKEKRGDRWVYFV
ncbi:MAG: hypothetical protein NC452_16980 [Eubacterium sp.]|nr:hypothetical protein [Eubacterium sp.]